MNREHQKSQESLADPGLYALPHIEESFSECLALALENFRASRGLQKKGSRAWMPLVVS